MKIAFRFYILFLFLLLNLGAFAADTTTVYSPDKQVQFKLFAQGSQLNFKVVFKGMEVIKTSPMIASINGQSITQNVKISNVKNYSINESYPWRGVHSTAVNHCNGTTILLTQNSFSYTLDVRVFDDGVAYQTIIPGKASDDRVPDEATVFNLPSQSTLWCHDLNMHYESVHQKNRIEDVQHGTWVAPPATFKLPQGIYASITEADLKNYPGMALMADGKNGLVVTLANNQPTSYPYRLRYSPEDTLRMLQPPHISGTITTPWRVVMIGSNLNALVNNDMVHNLCPPPDPALFPQGINTAWVRPGRAVWKYLNGGGDGTVGVMKHFTDGAAELGFEHNILEGFWSRWTDNQIRDLVNYSKAKGVDIWFWKHSKSLRNTASRDSFFARCHNLGVKGVKIDFFDSEAMEVIDLYTAILKETAKYQLMVDFHGADKPTGLARTYPNEMVREAVKGMEASKLTDRATHETTIPFTRLLAGPAEYTVVHLGARRQNTTWTHQLASAAILSAPLLTYAANPDTLFTLPKQALDVVKAIPATWDETIVLPSSEIGELAVYARRKGNAWFIAVMNGVDAKKISIPLTFLKSGSYKASVIKDDAAATDVVQTANATFTSKDVITLNLQSGGGYLAQLTK